MGNHSSHDIKKEYPNLEEHQINSIVHHIKKISLGSEIHLKEFEKLFDFWGPWAHVAFANIANKEHKSPEKISVKAIFHYANLLCGIASEQAEGLEIMFGGQVREALVGLSVFHMTLTPSESKSLLDVLTSDNSSSITTLIIGNRLAAELVRMPFSSITDSVRIPLPKLFGRSVLLDQAAQATIRAHLPVEYRDEWKLLFSTNENGSSFAQLTQRVDKQGPCVIVVRSTRGAVFGCYASKGFISGPTYTGDTLCFLFTASPSIRVYEATGIADKYCYLNFQQETLPNGLGMGGHDSSWPFFIAEDFGKGIACAHSSAFERGCNLAGESSFELETAEAWRVGPEPAKGKHEKSILDKDPQAQALLELSGRKMHSEAFREPAPLLDVSSDEEVTHETPKIPGKD